MATVSEELNELLEKRSQLQETLATLEQQIYNFEESYLEDAQLGGNLFQGLEGLVATTHNDRRSGRKVCDADRLFSMSSATFNKTKDAANHGASNKVTVSVKTTVGGSKDEQSTLPRKVIFKQKTGGGPKRAQPSPTPTLSKKQRHKDTGGAVDLH